MQSVLSLYRKALCIFLYLFWLFFFTWGQKRCFWIFLHLEVRCARWAAAICKFYLQTPNVYLKIFPSEVA